MSRISRRPAGTPQPPWRKKNEYFPRKSSTNCETGQVSAQRAPIGVNLVALLCSQGPKQSGTLVLSQIRSVVAEIYSRKGTQYSTTGRGTGHQSSGNSVHRQGPYELKTT